MAKRITAFLFLILAFALWQYPALLRQASAQRPRVPGAAKYSNFKHSSHKGSVKSLLTPGKKIDLDCAYCHGSAVRDRLGKDRHDIQMIGYPNQLNAEGSGKTHSSCYECHAFTGSRIERDMCIICHESMNVNPKIMSNNIKRFPAQDQGVNSEFYDYYSHAEHVGFFEEFIAQTPVKDRVRFFDSKADAKANKGLDKNKFECNACHQMNKTPVNVAKITFAPGVKESAPGHAECFICHFDPKIVSPPKAGKPDPKNTFATNCTGCHQDTGKPLKENRPVKGSELNTLWFARQIINNELNPPRPNAKPPQLPFSHKTHDEAVGKTVADCLSCHTTGKTAVTRSDFYLADKKTNEKQPLVTSCIDCHKKEMQTMIQGAVTLDTAKCYYCHSLQTVREYGARGVQLPPPNHFGGKPGPILAQNNPPANPTPQPPTPTPAPTPTPTATRPENPAPVKPTPTPVVAMNKPTLTPAQNVAMTPPTPAPAPTAPKPTPTPAPAPAPTQNVAVATPAPTPTPPTPSPAPAPAPTTANPSQDVGGAEPLPGKILLGDTKRLPKEWESSFQRGPTEFDHTTHIKPTYSKNCEECHHTNKNTKTESVRKCWECHFQEGFTSKESTVNLKDAYHGVPDGKLNAGCIECHKRYYEANPDKEKIGPTSKCAGCHMEKAGAIPPQRRPNWLVEQWTALLRSYRLDGSTGLIATTGNRR
jgi:hypothetical protein